jgi:hypothetical protein
VAPFISKGGKLVEIHLNKSSFTEKGSFPVVTMSLTELMCSIATMPGSRNNTGNSSGGFWVAPQSLVSCVWFGVFGAYVYPSSILGIELVTARIGLLKQI